MEPNFATVADTLDHYKAQLSDLTAKVATLEADKATAEKLMTEADARATDISGKLEAANVLITTGNAALADLTAKLTASETAKAEAEKAHAKLAADVARNPAFADASAGRPPVNEPTTTSANAEELFAQYHALTKSDPVAATKFYRENGLSNLARK